MPTIPMTSTVGCVLNGDLARRVNVVIWRGSPPLEYLEVVWYMAPDNFAVCSVRGLLAALLFVTSNSSVTHAAAAKQVDVWLTTRDKTNLLTEQPERLPFVKSSPNANTIVIDDRIRYQTMEGFGHALTGGTAQLMMKMSLTARTSLLQELFGTGVGQIGISYIRISVGASDMNDHVYTYDDLPAGQTDPDLKQFSLDPDRADVIPLLREVLAINPRIAILASSWTAPSWMKDNGEVKGGTLKKEYYGTYANYWVKYLQEMRAEGITIDALPHRISRRTRKISQHGPNSGRRSYVHWEVSGCYREGESNDKDHKLRSQLR